MRDLRYALRSLLKSPGFTAVAVASLALGIGANTAIFSVANGLLFRPLPFHDPDRLVLLWNRFPGLNIDQDWPSPAQYLEMRARSTSYESMAIAISGSFNVIAGDSPERLDGLRVSSSMLPMLGIQPALGRSFTPEEDQPGKPQGAIISHGLWQRRFGGDRDLAGKSIALNGQTHTVIGVLGPDFTLGNEIMPTVGGIERADILTQLPLSDEALKSHENQNFNVIGRLKPGVSVQRAQAEMNAIAARLIEAFPRHYPRSSGFAIAVVPMLEQVVGNVRPAVWILLGAVGFVLLIACANVANLLLSRATAREKEIAIRAAVGAGRSQLLRQLLTESILLSTMGAAIGLLLATWGTRALRLLGPINLPRLENVSINGTVLAFTATLALATGLAFGLLPALRASRVDLNEVLKEGGRSSMGGGSLWTSRHRLRGILVVAELALSVVLLIGAGLLVRSFARVQKIDPGFAAKNVLTFRVTFTGPAYSHRDTIRLFFDRLLPQLQQTPGVKEAALVSLLPLSPGVGWGNIEIEGETPRGGEGFVAAEFRVASPNYFRTMGIPLRQGRFFEERDLKDNPPVVIVDDHFARQYWPKGDAIGKRVRRGPVVPGSWQTVVGVVGSVKQYALETEGRVVMYSSSTQLTIPSAYVALRTEADPSSMLAQVRSQVRLLDPELPIYQVATMEQRLAGALARRRFAMWLLTVFAGIALVLAAIGIYGVMAYLVSQSTHEIGIRMALGAGRQTILGMVVSQSMLLALAGIGLGVAGAVALTRLMSTMLYGVSATDAATFAAIPLLLASVALAACYLPARRASKVDPMIALRHE